MSDTAAVGPGGRPVRGARRSRAGPPRVRRLPPRCRPRARRFGVLFIWLGLAGGAGSSVNSASGRAVMHWFPAEERGLALGIRQTAIPVGGLVGALAVPAIANAGGTDAAFVFLAALCAAGALAGVLLLRAREPGDAGSRVRPRTLADARLWRLSFGSGVYLYAQMAVIGFTVVFLHDEHGLSTGEAALVVAASQLLGAAFRIGAGRWSDVVGSRVGPLRLIGLAVAVSLGATPSSPMARSGSSSPRWRSQAGCPWAGTGCPSRLPPSSQVRRGVALRSASSRRCCRASASPHRCSSPPRFLGIVASRVRTCRVLPPRRLAWCCGRCAY